ncbi:hypothetical protein AVEN_131350-1 [Araneus ventricosus]|uniref:Uncharacterized protein n=1 Tax=Araneus ventricosus TaxID=182803 RepID=A0A4Y2PII2_ARAVE|nr:hypothetical protein AVEN_137042-1 [Araneus ventricosus]GBN50007.1 hypothetical protein AVEN_131350-1 [Araneus ventricosus]
MSDVKTPCNKSQATIRDERNDNDLLRAYFVRKQWTLGGKRENKCEINSNKKQKDKLSLHFGEFSSLVVTTRPSNSVSARTIARDRRSRASEKEFI